MKEKTSEKRKGSIKFDFPFGTEEWQFAYTTILHLRRVILPTIIEENDAVRVGKHLDRFNIIPLIGDAKAAYGKKANIKLGGMQTVCFVRAVDNLAQTMLDDDDMLFTNEFTEIVNQEIGSTIRPHEMKKNYLGTAQTLVEGYKKLCDTIELGDELLKLLDMTDDV